jgi:hypothetical protein
MRKVKGYHVIEGNSPADLEKEVIEFLQNGFVPAGGVFIINIPDQGISYFQAIVLYDE